MEHLPAELKRKISSFLTSGHVVEFAQVNKQIHQDIDIALLISPGAQVGLSNRHWSGLRIDDRPQVWSSIPLILEKITHSVIFSCKWKDQGWGNMKSKIYITSRNKDVDRSPMERQINDGNQTIVVESSVCGHNITNLELFFTPKPDTIYELWRYAGTGGSHELFVHGVEIKQLVHGRINVKIYNSLVHHNYLLNTPGNNLAWRMMMAIAEEQLERIDNNMMQVEENDRFATVLESMGADRRNKESLEILRVFCASLLADNFISKNGLNGDYSDASIQPFYYDS